MGWLPKLTFGILLPAPIAVIAIKLLSWLGLSEIPTVPAIILSAVVYFFTIALATCILKMRKNEPERLME